MKLRKKKPEKWAKTDSWKGKKGGVNFTVTQSLNTKFYILANKDGESFNSLWFKEEYDTLEKAREWCENFDFEKYLTLKNKLNEN